MEKDFIIDKVSWHTQDVLGDRAPEDFIHGYFRTIIEFLQKNQLVKRTILLTENSIIDETCIHSDDLTEEGMLFIRKCYTKWQRSNDRTGKFTNVKILEKALLEIRIVVM
jgi:hypothetical protein